MRLILGSWWYGNPELFLRGGMLEGEMYAVVFPLIVFVAGSLEERQVRRRTDLIHLSNVTEYNLLTK